MDVLCDAEGRRRVNVGAIYGGDGDSDQLEDDAAFYAELVRQLLILTADDDDDDSSAAIPCRSSFGYFDSSMPQPAAGTWPAVSTSRNGGGFGGTGVFIPQGAAKSRRRSGYGRRGRSSSNKQQAQKVVENKH